jgi:hypothetical protein
MACIGVLGQGETRQGPKITSPRRSRLNICHLPVVVIIQDRKVDFQHLLSPPISALLLPKTHHAPPWVLFARRRPRAAAREESSMCAMCVLPISHQQYVKAMLPHLCCDFSNVGKLLLGPHTMSYLQRLRSLRTMLRRWRLVSQPRPSHTYVPRH